MNIFTYFVWIKSSTGLALRRSSFGTLKDRCSSLASTVSCRNNIQFNNVVVNSSYANSSEVSRLADIKVYILGTLYGVSVQLVLHSVDQV